MSLRHVALVLSLLVAFLHVGFMVLESMLWTTPKGLKIFGMSAEQAEATKVLALNQGAYNGLVAALLAWAALTQKWETVAAVLVFIAIAGVVGGVTAARSILVLQMVPALVALGVVVAVLQGSGT